MDIAATVDRLIKYCGTDNPVRIAKELGIKIMYAPLGGKKYGKYIKCPEIGIFVLAKSRGIPEKLVYLKNI